MRLILYGCLRRIPTNLNSGACVHPRARPRSLASSGHRCSAVLVLAVAGSAQAGWFGAVGYAKMWNVLPLNAINVIILRYKMLAVTDEWHQQLKVHLGP